MNKSSMKVLGVAISLALATMLTASAWASGVKWTYPAIAGFGPVHPLPNAAVQPSKSAIYKVVFDVTAKSKDMSKPNPGLDHVARAVNVFASAGVPLSHLKFIAVVHGPATASVLNNEHYHGKYGTNNPNIPLIAALKKAGVKVEVCGQALADNSYEHAWVNRDVTITLSALSDLIIYGHQGYAYVLE